MLRTEAGWRRTAVGPSFHFLFLLIKATVSGMGIGRTSATLEKTGQREFAPQRTTYSRLCTELPETNLPAELWGNTGSSTLNWGVLTFFILRRAFFS